MTRRYETATADCDLRVIPSDTAEDAGLEDVPPGSYALIIGNPWASAFAVIGPPEDLLRFASKIADTVQGIRPVIPGTLARPRAALDHAARTPPHARRAAPPQDAQTA
jgi:hypothetical protein